MQKSIADFDSLQARIKSLETDVQKFQKVAEDATLLEVT